MDVLNRLKSAVTNVLPVGNPITNEFEINNHLASGGPGLMWKICDGVSKTTKQEASIFFFEKKQLDRFSKRDREILLESLKKGVSQLTKLRHPKILSVVHGLEDSRESLAFATEPIFASLANILGQHDNLPHPPPPYLKDFSLFDIEIRHGLLQVAEGLAFLHGSARIIHGNCCPESIFINKFGCWKLAGFEHCIINANVQGEPYYPYREYDQHSDPITQPKLNYLAPEYGLIGSCDVSSDMFSFGMTVYSIYNKGCTLYDCMADWRTYKLNASELRNISVSRLSEIPDSMRDCVKLLFNIDSTLRPDADQLSKLPYFEEVGVMTLRYLDLLVQKDNLQKSQFFKDLTPIVAKLPKRVNLQRILPSVSKECHNPNMVPFILPTILEVAKMASNEEYSNNIFPVLIPLFKLTEPIQVMLIMLQNMSSLLNKTSQADIRNHILPMISRALEVNIPQMQDLCLSHMPTFASLVEYTSLKNLIVPRICKLCLSQTSLSIRVNCLVCLGKLLEYLDKWYVLDEVLPILQTIQSKEPAILMSILGIYKIALSHKKLGITKEILANKIIPFLMPACIENNLNLSQFNSFISVVKEMIQQVENEHRSKLEQLDSMQQEQKTLQKFAQETIQGSIMQDGLNDKNSLAQLNQPTNPFDDTFTKTSATQAAPKKPVSLTMEEKERLARQQELENRFKTTSNPLQPLSSKSPPTSTIKTSSKDLTSTLISNNLSMLSLTSQTPTMMSNSVATATGHKLGQSFSQTFPNYGNASLMSGPAMNNSTFINNIQPHINQPTQQRATINKNVFDSINTGINPKQTKSQPMYMMTSGVQSFNQSNQSFNQSNQPFNQSNQLFTQSMNQSFNQPMNQSLNFSNINPSMNNSVNLMNSFNSSSSLQDGNLQQTKQALSTKEIQDFLG